MSALSPMPPTSNPKTKSWLRLFFFEPLCYFGSIGIVYAVSITRNPPADWLKAFGVMVIGVTLLLAGLASVQARYHDEKTQSLIGSNRALYPEMPWMWPEDWSQGRAQSKNPSSTIRTWLFALIWCLVSTLILINALTSDDSFTKRALAILLAAAGAILLIISVHRTMRLEKFGKTWLELTTLPGVIGRELKGTIHVNFPQSPNEGVLLKLNCTNLVTTGGGRQQITTETILWSEEHTVPSRQVHGGPGGLAIPVDFKIRADSMGTSNEKPRDRIVWSLHANAKLPGVDYQDTFEVPIFRTRDSPCGQVEEISHAPVSPSLPVVLSEQPQDAGIIVRPVESGGTEFKFSAGRNTWLALRATLFCFAFTGFIGYCLSVKVELVFLAVFIILDLVLLVSALLQWLGTSKVIIRAGRLEVHKGILELGTTREIPFTQIESIIMPIGSYEERSSNTAYYDLKLQLNTGEQVVLANAIRKKREVEWLIARMKSEIGLNP